jgi:hypothetical protein
MHHHHLPNLLHTYHQHSSTTVQFYSKPSYYSNHRNVEFRSIIGVILSFGASHLLAVTMLCAIYIYTSDGTTHHNSTADERLVGHW